MGRDSYTEPVTRLLTLSVDVAGVPTEITLLEPLAGVEITVYRIGADGNREVAPANLFATRNPGDNTPFANPFVTPAGGKTGFWADGGDYDVVFHDTASPARIGDQFVGWQAISGAQSGIVDEQLPEQGRKQWDPGDLLFTARPTLKPGFLWADGSVVSRATYADLYNEIGTAYNQGGESSAQFRLPDYRGRVPVGADNMGVGAAGRLPNTNRTLGQSHGAELTVLTAAQSGVGAHGHGITDPGHIHEPEPEPGKVDTSFAVAGDGDVLPLWSNQFGLGTYNWPQFRHRAVAARATGVTVQNNAGAAASQGHSNIQPGQICHVQIKY